MRWIREVEVLTSVYGQTPWLFLAELEALGDDFLGEDEDTSYLDAVSAPDPPTGIPGGSSKEDGVKLDEFGLPVLNS